MSLRSQAHLLTGRAIGVSPLAVWEWVGPPKTHRPVATLPQLCLALPACGGYSCRHLGGLSKLAGGTIWTHSCNLQISYCDCGLLWLHKPQFRRGARAYLGAPYLIRLHVAPRPTLAEPFRPNYGRDAVRSPVIVNCWTQDGDYSMTPATRCPRRRRRSAIRRSDRLPSQPAFRARDCSHRGSR
jgi:hypothetical protein